MSKVDDLRIKYPVVTSATFKKFVEADQTPTKKYLEYFLKSWINRESNQCPSTTNALIELVKSFDDLLQYIENKDIYSKDYYDISLLKVVVARAEEVKEEKTFNRDEHVCVLEENDDYILLQPLTHRGSLRYGANTRWCTASRNDISVFQRYTKGGLLLYLIDKKHEKTPAYRKVALYSSYIEDALTDGFRVYNSSDNDVQSETIMNNGWSEETFMKVITYFKILFLREKKLKKSKDYIQTFGDTIKRLDFETLLRHMDILEQNKSIDYTSNVQEQINVLLNKLNNINYARITETKS
jgi:hypothetical protein